MRSKPLGIPPPPSRSSLRTFLLFHACRWMSSFFFFFFRKQKGEKGRVLKTRRSSQRGRRHVDGVRCPGHRNFSNCKMYKRLGFLSTSSSFIFSFLSSNSPIFQMRFNSNLALSALLLTITKVKAAPSSSPQDELWKRASGAVTTSVKTASNQSYDYIIVGAGLTGESLKEESALSKHAI